MPPVILRDVRLENFKAIRASGAIKLTPLTVLIGNNGSGKSSIVEALMTLQKIATEGLDNAMQDSRGFEYVRHYAAKTGRQGSRNLALTQQGISREANSQPMTFVLNTSLGRASLSVNASISGDEIFISEESLKLPQQPYTLQRDARGRTQLLLTGETRKKQADRKPIPASETPVELTPLVRSYADGEPILRAEPAWQRYMADWQFLLLNPQAMGQPRPQRRVAGAIKLNPDGSNIAEYLLDIRNQDAAAFDGIVETLRYVLPYASDLRPAVTSELERNVYLQLFEGSYSIPGWLLSTGTLRILALLAVLRHPSPPPLLVVEEIENGLDPRTIHLLVEELRSVVESGIMQIIVTTHSPYLLDLLPLSSIILVERIQGEPNFIRPADQEHLAAWAAQFSPGQLYTMERLNPRGAA